MATVGAQRTTLRFQTNRGDINFECLDIAGQAMFRQLATGYMIGADAAILMFDVTSRTSYKNISSHHRDIVGVRDHIPMVLCGNKVDMKTRVVKPSGITFHKRKNIQYCEISAKTNYNIRTPFVYLARKLCQEPSMLLDEPVRIPETSILSHELQQHEAELAAAQPCPAINIENSSTNFASE